MSFNSLLTEASLAALRIITGELLSEKQINLVTKHSVGRYFSDIFPEDQEAKSHQSRIAAASSHIATASEIIRSMNSELDAQKETLELLVSEIEEKSALAERYSILAKANEKEAAAIKAELADSVRVELKSASEEGKNVRRFVSFTIWLFTLIAGAALGAYFTPDIPYEVQFSRALRRDIVSTSMGYIA